jgi:hypothetical protein
MFDQDDRQARDERIDRVRRHARSPFVEVALDLLYEYASKNEEVFIDDFYAFAKDRLPETHDLRALGAVIKAGFQNGWITHSGEYRLSKGGGGSPRKVWVSTVRQADPALF